MTSLGTIPRRLVECGGAVEEPGGLWHIARSDAATYCGEECKSWPRVAFAVERAGIWCGVCLMTAAEEYGAGADSRSASPVAPDGPDLHVVSGAGNSHSGASGPGAGE